MTLKGFDFIFTEAGIQETYYEGEGSGEDRGASGPQYLIFCDGVHLGDLTAGDTPANAVTLLAEESLREYLENIHQGPIDEQGLLAAFDFANRRILQLFDDEDASVAVSAVVIASTPNEAHTPYPANPSRADSVLIAGVGDARVYATTPDGVETIFFDPQTPDVKAPLTAEERILSLHNALGLGDHMQVHVQKRTPEAFERYVAVSYGFHHQSNLDEIRKLGLKPHDKESGAGKVLENKLQSGHALRICTASYQMEKDLSISPDTDSMARTKMPAEPEQKRRTDRVKALTLSLVACLAILFITVQFLDQDTSKPVADSTSPTTERESSTESQSWVTALREESRLQQDKINSLTQDLRELTQQNHDLTELLAASTDPKTRSVVEEMTLKLREKEEAVSELREGSEELRSRLHEQAVRIRELEQEIAELEKEAKDQASESLAQAKRLEQFEALKMTHEDLKNSLSQKLAEGKELFLQEVNELESTVAVLQKTAEENGELAKHLSQERALLKHIQVGKEELADALATTDALIAELGTTQALLEQDLRHMRSRLAEQNRRQEETKHRQQALEKALNREKELAQLLPEKEARITELTARTATLSQLLDGSRIRKQKQEETIAALKQEVDTQRKLIENQDQGLKTLDELQAAKEDLEMQRDTLREQIRIRDENFEELKLHAQASEKRLEEQLQNTQLAYESASDTTRSRERDLTVQLDKLQMEFQKERKKGDILKSELQSKLNELAEVRTQVPKNDAKLDEALVEARAKETRLTRKIEAQEQELARLSQALANVEKKPEPASTDTGAIQAAQQELSSLSTQLAQARKTLEKKDNLIGELRQTNLNYQGRYRDLEEQLSRRLDESMQAYGLLQDEMRSQQARHEEVVQTLQLESRKLRKEKQVLLEDLASADQSSTVAISAKERQRELERLVREMEQDYVAKIDSLTSAYQAELERTQALDSRVRQLHGQLQARGPQSTTVESLQNQVKELKTALAKDRGPSLREELQNMEKAFLASQERVKELQTSQSESAKQRLSTGEEMTQLQLRLEELSAAYKTQVKELNASLEEEASRSSRLAAELSKSKAAVESQLEKERGNYESTLASLEVRRESLENDLQTALRDLREKEAEIARAESIKSQMDERLEQLENRYKNELTEATLAQAAKEREIAQLQTRFDRLSRRTKDQEESLVASTVKVERLQGSNDSLEEARQKLLDEKTALSERLAAMEEFQAMYQSERRLRQEREKQLEAFTANLQEQKSSLATIEKNRKSLASELEKIRGQYQELLSEPARRPKAQLASIEPQKNRRAANTRIHLVSSGETLSGIAMRYYGSANRWKELHEANKDVISDTHHLRVGTALIIP